MTHGLKAYWNGLGSKKHRANSCRCEVCTEAYRVYMAQHRLKKARESLRQAIQQRNADEQGMAA